LAISCSGSVSHGNAAYHHLWTTSIIAWTFSGFASSGIPTVPDDQPARVIEQFDQLADVVFDLLFGAIAEQWGRYVAPKNT
jgi:hypothetical protein